MLNHQVIGLKNQNVYSSNRVKNAKLNNVSDVNHGSE